MGQKDAGNIFIKTRRRKAMSNENKMENCYTTFSPVTINFLAEWVPQQLSGYFICVEAISVV